MTKEFIDAKAKLLHQLVEEGAVSASRVKSQAAIVLFDRLQQSEIIRKQRKGSGNHFQVMHAEALLKFIKDHYPNGLQEIASTAELPSRIRGVLQSQDSKVQRKLDFTFLTVRGDVVIHHTDKSLDLNNLTDENTSLSLKISESTFCNLPAYPCDIVSVENPTVFVELERIFKGSWQVAVYTAGKMSNLLLVQLAQWGQQGHRLIHFGDYDYVGLLEFSRILKVCPTARLYTPRGLRNLIQSHGKGRLLEKQISQHRELSKVIESLSDSAGKQELLSVYSMLQTTAKGFEQEGVFQPHD